MSQNVLPSTNQNLLKNMKPTLVLALLVARLALVTLVAKAEGTTDCQILKGWVGDAWLQTYAVTEYNFCQTSPTGNISTMYG
jgi:hypothetical protein